MSSENKEPNTMDRRDMLKTIGAAAAGMAAAAVSSGGSSRTTASRGPAQESLRRGAEHRPAVPAILQANAVRPEPDELLPRQ